MKKVTLTVNQVIKYRVGIEVEVNDDHNIEALSEAFANIVRKHSDEFPDDAAHHLSESVENVKIIDAPRYEQYKNDAEDWEMEYYGECEVVEVIQGD